MIASPRTRSSARQGLFHKATRLWLDASPVFISQLAFSVVSFFSVAGLSRQVNAELLACAIAIYSLESLQVSWLDARYVNFLVLRGPLNPTRGDALHVIRSTALVASLGAPVLFLAGFFVRHDWQMALFATFWASGMCLADVMRYLASRYQGSRVIGTLGMIHVVCAVPFTLFWKGSPQIFLLSLAGMSLLLALACAVVMLRSTRGTRSDFWLEDRDFGKSLGVEAAASAAAVGLSGVLIAWINPRIAVGLQLANQIVGMPATVLSQAISLPLSRELRKGMDERRFPTRVTLFWLFAMIAFPLGVALGVVIAKPLVFTLLGERADLAYMFLPVILVQTIGVLLWQPITLARRWTAGPRNVYRHVAFTLVAYYVLVVLAVLLIPESRAVAALVAVAGGLTISVVVRVILWTRTLINEGIPEPACDVSESPDQ